jgi:geranylgeranyl diphosphate synthase, type I
MPGDPARPGPAGADQACLSLIRAEVAKALETFLDRQRVVLSAMGDDMLPWLDAMDGLLAGGKRLRPAFCYWGWRAAGGRDCPEVFTAATALELLQASALIHDDVMDASDTRRGRPAVHRQFATGHLAAGYAGSAEDFGVGAAILVGDVLLSWTDELYHASGFPAETLRRGQPVLDAMRTEVAAGQYLDLVNQFSASTSVAAAMRVITYKTAKYTIERPLHLGAALAGSPPALGGSPPGRARAGQRAPGTRDAEGNAVPVMCTDYGIPLGIAFQLRDDVLGVFGDPARTGKPVSGDIREGKRTVLVALAMERASAADAALLDSCLGDRGLTEAAADEARAVINETGALAECESMIAANVKEAVSALDGAPIPEDARAALTTLAFMATDRDE